VVGEAGREQVFHGAGMGRQALALPADLSIPAKTVVFEAAQDAMSRAGDFPGGVDVIDAHEPFTAGIQGLEVTGRSGDE
jgi:hypothetical protein